VHLIGLLEKLLLTSTRQNITVTYNDRIEEASSRTHVQQNPATKKKMVTSMSYVWKPKPVQDRPRLRTPTKDLQMHSSSKKNCLIEHQETPSSYRGKRPQGNDAYRGHRTGRGFEFTRKLGHWLLRLFR